MFVPQDCLLVSHVIDEVSDDTRIFTSRSFKFAKCYNEVGLMIVWIFIRYKTQGRAIVIPAIYWILTIHFEGD